MAKKNKKVQEFLGIPYAKPPVGNLRWKAPVKPDPSDRVWEAYYFGDSAMQSDNLAILLREHTQSEDCLTLNIWRTASKDKNDKLKPVLVYVHGGDLAFEGSAEPLYYGGNFVKKFPEVIVVSFNYRLGIFGFLNIDDVPWADEYTDSGNLGIMDQVMALNWVHDNIRSFGGDPDNVMLAGDTMGAYCIKILSVLKESKDLFKKALLISVNTFEQEGTYKLPRVIFKDVMKEMGVSTMSEMLNISFDALKQFMSDNTDKYWYVPTYGKGILNINLEQAIKDGETGNIKFIYGIPADEFSALLSVGTEEDMNAWGNSAFDDIIKVYEGTKEKDNLIKMFEKYKNDGSDDIEAKRKTLEFWLYKYDVIRNCIALSDLGKSVKCFYWEVNSPIKKFGGNSISMIGALLGNFSSAEELGYLINNTVADVFQHLIYNELSKDNADLTKNEVRGVHEIKWKSFNSAYPMILHITDDNIELDDNLLIEEINTVKRWNVT
ncbi:MAG: carboxylesterase family protein [Lachnospiraceae bacterium]|nr:carboxylesterase family protein [Lachnospiraceae bacterium]